MKKIVLLSAVTSTMIIAGGDIISETSVVDLPVAKAPVAKSATKTKVEIYGQAHLSADSVDNGTNSTTTIASSSSRLGIRASHELAENLSIIGQYETGVDLTGDGVDDGNGGDFTGGKGLFTRTRDSYLGLASNYGTLLAGRVGAQNQWIYDYNLFADQVGDLGNILGAGGVGPDRASRTIAYISPTFSGLNATVAYMTPNSNNGTGDVSAVVGKINYDMGNGFKAGLGYINVEPDVAGTNNPNEIALTTSYTQDIFSIGGGYAMMNNTGGNGIDRNVAFIGASVKPMDNLTLKAHYAKLNDDQLNSDANMYAIGVDYDLYKNVTAYVAYSKTNNDANAAYLANNWGHGKSQLGAPVAGYDPSAISVGLVYKFNASIFEN